MHWMLFVAALITFVAAAAVSFVVIARKGRALRKNQPLPPPAAEAFLLWDENGKKEELQVETPFYFGRNPECQVVIPAARALFEVCIFYHHSRFAFQSLPGAAALQINGEERPAGYLWDGDVLQIASRQYTFRCY